MSLLVLKSRIFEYKPILSDLNRASESGEPYVEFKPISSNAR